LADDYHNLLYTKSAMNDEPKELEKQDVQDLRGESERAVPRAGQDNNATSLGWDILKGVIWGIILYVFAVIFGLMAYAFFSQNLPPLSRIENYKPPEASTVYDRYDQPVFQFFVQRREYVRYQRIPEMVVNAFIAMEDRNFWNHWGIDVNGIIRALIVNITHGKIVQGASTITQQLARNMFLSHKKTLKRKIQEAILAVRIEQAFSKQEIIEKYLNQIYFGHGVYGIQTASKFYFDKNVWELNLSEIALLVAIPRSPEIYSPLRNPELAEKRRRLVLRVMLREGVIDSVEYEKAVKDTPRVVDIERKLQQFTGIAPYFMEMVRRDISRRYGDEFLYKSGARIYTTLDPKLQAYAEEAVKTMLDRFEEKYNLHPSRAEYHPTNPDSEPPQYLQAALVAMDPKTGEILALVGGRDFKESKFNRVTQAKRQPGSAFKVFVYTAAIDRGFTPADLIPDEPVEAYERGMPRRWIPQNYDGKYLGMITLRKALALSRNLATVQLAMRLAPERSWIDLIIDYAHRMGIESELPSVYSIVLGSADVTLLEMVRAYATIANYGVKTRPYYIRRVEDKNGEILEVNGVTEETVLDSTTAFIMISMLRSVLDEGTAISARSVYGFHAPAAGKTGTTNEYRDAWFIGFTPDLIAGVWVGYDSLRPIKRGATGAMFAVPIWSQFMLKATQNTWKDFTVPHGLTWRKICTESGLLATPMCPKTRMEVFKIGYEPTELCTLHFRRNREIQQLYEQEEFMSNFSDSSSTIFEEEEGLEYQLR